MSSPLPSLDHPGLWKLLAFIQLSKSPVPMPKVQGLADDIKGLLEGNLGRVQTQVKLLDAVVEFHQEARAERHALQQQRETTATNMVKDLDGSLGYGGRDSTYQKTNRKQERRVFARFMTKIGKRQQSDKQRR